ncbi:hypothetical protein [Aurantibacillus circumpalustris]|uniref:hypothetical protein n=1 Tax=Aurantibacillus circumpalustris TaxID=3036359 RepID=UPI00295AAAA7|nr:hypothetical protein [Aurantibacillus circumpalustris]
MKIKLILLALAFCAKTFAGDGDKLTLKEKIEQNKVVKVFFTVRDIIDENDERLLRASNPNAKTSIRTTMPSEYSNSEIKNSLMKTLNDGLQVGNAFVEGDIAELPESANSKTHFRDLSKLADGFYAIVYIQGEYNRTIVKNTVAGNVVLDVSNKMEIRSHLFFYEVVNSDVKKYGDMFMRSGVLLGNANSITVKSTQLENIDYMEKVFPALSLLDEYKSSMQRFASDFASKQLSKHDKAVSKRK